MRKSLLVTGASGLLGANVCKKAAEQGRRVLALVRHEDDAATLKPFGVEAVLGDLSDVKRLIAGMKDVEGVIHTAALVGGTWATATPAEFDDINYGGVLRVLDAAKGAGIRRTLLVSSVAIIDATHTMTERSQIQPISDGDSPYVKSKRASYYEGMHRACRGDNIAFLFPGAIYGPSPNMDRALVATSFNGAMLRGVRGELAEYAAFPFNWVFVDDVALIALAAIDEESVGERYIAAGRSEDEMPLALFCNKAASMVGSPHRVVNRPLAAVAASLGYMAATAARVYATPYIDAHVTRERLGISVTTLEDGLHVTLKWLRTAGRLQD